MPICQRSEEKELLDLGSEHYTAEEYADCLYQLQRVGALLGGDRASEWALTQFSHAPRSILDVGCGGGFFTERLARLYPEARVLGIDLAPEAISFAKRRLEGAALKNLYFQVCSSSSMDSLGKFDLLVSTLTCHHLTDQELVHFLKSAFQQANGAIIINDLQRNPLAYYSYALLAPLLFHNRLITQDGLLSIKKGFTRQEWNALLTAAGIPLSSCSISWCWAFRWLVIIRKKDA